MANVFVKLIFIVLNFSPIFVGCDRMTSKIYESIQADNFCYRQLNATHQIGCTSNAEGNVGVVHVLETPEDLQWILEEGPDPPYVAALYVSFFNMTIMADIKDSDRVAGVLVFQSENSSFVEEPYSPDKSCPNDNFGLYADHSEYASCAKGAWNPPNPALNMLYQNWGKPIILIKNETDIQNIVDGCYKRFNAPVNNTARPLPLCAAELGSFMLAAKDSPTCIRRSNMYNNMNPVKLCDPLGSRNVITTLFPTNKEEPLKNNSVIVIAARLDAASMFDGIVPGADSAVTALVSLLSIANTLSLHTRNMKKPEKNVLFAIFNGESFDYIGSSRTVYDMELNAFPQTAVDGKQQPAMINLEHISHFIELNQVGPQINTSAYFIHRDPISTNSSVINKAVNDIVRMLQSYGNTFKFNVTDASHPLPPASVQRFLRKRIDIPSVVITNFDKAFTNKHYNSRFDLEDDLSNEWEKYLEELSTAVSETVLELLTNEKPTNVSADGILISDMMDCYLKNASCKLFQQIASPAKLERWTFRKTRPYSMYVSVDNGGNINPITIYTRYLMSYLTGEHLENYIETNCSSNDTNDLIYQYDWMVGFNVSNPGICVKSTVMFTIAVSPAAELNDWESTEYSTWTESVWHSATLRIFLRPSRKLEGLTLGVGCIIFAFSLLLVYSANKRADLLFGSRGIIGC